MLRRRRYHLWLALLVVGVLLRLAGGALAQESADPPAPGDDGLGLRVVVLPIEGNIDLGLAPFVERIVAENADAAAIVLDIDTFGGRVDAAVKIRDALLDARPPVIAYVNRRAISAGALIAYAADTLVFAPGSSMGAATPIQMAGDEVEAVDEKVTSYMRAEMRATAEANGRDGAIAEAMVDRTLVVEGVVDGTKVLTVSTEDAVRIGLADGVAASLRELLEGQHLGRAEQSRVETNWGEDVARVLTDPTVSGMLMSLGMLGLLIELYTPGFGLAGGVGLLCLGLFFGGHFAANLAGLEELVLLLIGLIALAVEVFVIPGFGIVGIIGLTLIIAALALSLVGMPLQVSWDLGFVGDAVRRVLISIGATIIIGALVIRFLPTRLLPNWLILRTKLSNADHASEVGPENWHSAPDQAHLVGTRGEAITDLRLAGKARLNGAVVDVVSMHEYISRGQPVEVVEVEGVRVVVVRVAEVSNKDGPGSPAGPVTAT